MPAVRVVGADEGDERAQLEAARVAAGAGASPRPGTVAAAPAAVQDTGGAVDASAEATQDGGLASFMRAAKEKLENRTREFDVPPYDVWHGRLVAKLRQVKLVDGKTFEALIVEATTDVFVHEPGTAGGYRRDAEDGMVPDPEGEWRRLDGWAAVGELMGVGGDGVTLGRVVRAVCGSTDVLNGWAESVVAWMMGRASLTERILGE
jgi:hypothetical protein